MVLTPATAVRLTAPERELLDALEARIDEHLASRASPGLPILLDGPWSDTRLRHAIVDRYERAGWLVTYRIEPNHFYLEFKAPRRNVRPP